MNNKSGRYLLIWIAGDHWIDKTENWGS